ncbi:MULTISPECIES: MarR family transcriptional regulator [unclassified Sphingomonas]|jgi:MarR family transcriptional regulator, organic hydroperoxide resistance regulator|uniref:MarR family winged helix-turn-helix transcriptional regulator n=1 Tax=unclassified Sphingomonas TaxID=196159 RepID=UPI000AD7942F|nr:MULTISPECIES: MarR family transcriptional regulator [unclassified Sphingomonas]
MNAPGEPLPLDAQLCFSLYSASIAINRLYKPMLDSLGVTYPQYLVLSTLWERDGQTISAIAERLALEPSTITPLMKRLEAAGFVARRRNPEDERQVQVFLNPPGRELRSRASCLTDALLANSKLSVPQMIALNDQVRRLRAALTGEDAG